MKPLVTFDLWETLICEPEGAGAARRTARLGLFAAALADFGWRVDRERLTEAYDRSWEEIRTVWRRHEDIDIPAQVRDWLSRLGDGQPALSPGRWKELEHLYVKPFLDLTALLIPGAPEALAAARAAGFTVGLISNTGRTPGWALRECMVQHGLLDHLDFALFSNEERVRKPGAEIFHRAARRAGVKAGIHVGDNYAADVEGAHGAGWRTVWITSDPGSVDRPVADATWTDIAAAVPWFAGHSRVAQTEGKD